jgi:hypothetical protein
MASDFLPSSANQRIAPDILKADHAKEIGRWRRIPNSFRKEDFGFVFP